MAIFEIPDLAKTVPLTGKTQGGKTVYEGSTTFTITNTTDQGLSGRVAVQPQTGAKPEWFKLDQSDRDFPAKGTQTFTVKLSVPDDATGKYAFDLLAVNVADPDNLFTKSPAVAFEIPAKVKTPFPIWIPIVAGVVLLLVVGIVLYFVLSSGGTPTPPPTAGVIVPNVVGLTTDQAKAKLTAAGFTVSVADDDASNAAPGTVTTEAPAADGTATAPSGSEVKLAAAVGVVVPDVGAGKSYDFVAGILTGAGLTPARVNVAAAGNAPDTVISLNPAAGTHVARQSTVTANTDPGVLVPDVRNLQANAAVNELTQRGLYADIYQQAAAGTVNQVINQNPLNPQMVAKGAHVVLNVRIAPNVTPCTTKFCLIDSIKLQPSQLSVVQPVTAFKAPLAVKKMQ
jgi:hypothetical protein